MNAKYRNTESKKTQNTFISLSCLIAWARTSNIINGGSESGYLCLTPGLRGESRSKVRYHGGGKVVMDVANEEGRTET